MTANAITLALSRADRGEPGAAEELWQLVYQDLRKLAAVRLQQLGPGQTLQATALVNEAWVKLEGGESREWDSRAHFFGAAARAMRNILVDQARRKGRLRRNAGRQPETLDAELTGDEGAESIDLLALDEALDAFAADYPRPSQIIMLRYFTGLSVPQIAETLQVSPRTVNREFLFARTWLRRRLTTD